MADVLLMNITYGLSNRLQPLPSYNTSNVLKVGVVINDILSNELLSNDYNDVRVFIRYPGVHKVKQMVNF
jgi:hypothetical protein